NHSLEPGGDFAEAEFNAGWIALRFLNNPERAETHFLALASSVATPISISRAYYWLGRTASAQDNEALARSYYQAAAEHYYSYYGQLAAEALGGDALEKRFAPPRRATPEEKARFGSRPTVAALRMLSDLDLDYEFMVFSYHIDGELDRPGEYLELAALTSGEGAPHLTVRAGKVAIQRNAFTPEVAYPLVFVPDDATRFVSPEIILGLSRQESEFNPRAYSRAGARGMMQLLPSTAQITAQKEGLRYSRSALLDDPVYNMTIGSAHLSHLLDRFDGSLVLTFAAYNAGALRAEQWIAAYGDPRSDAIDPVDWVEQIPFSETRNYVQRVLENTQVYRGRLSDRPIPGRLSADLERGGARARVARPHTAPSPSVHKAGFTEQPLTPMPRATIERAVEFKLARMLGNNPSLEEAPPAANELEESAPSGPTQGKAQRPRTVLPLSPDPAPISDIAPTNVSAQAPMNETPLVIEASATPAETNAGKAANVTEMNETAARVEREVGQAPAPRTPISRPPEPAISLLEPADAPAPLNEKPAPVIVEEFISRLYESGQTPSSDDALTTDETMTDFSSDGER
ncbi:MAG: lytic transglycosylase domain-containing protein, partial [Hyphococcus sp.]